MTDSVMAVPHGSPARGVDSPRASARANVKQSVTARDRRRTLLGARVARIARVVYLDAADSWIAEERSPSAKTVWHTDWTAHLDVVWAPYAVWTNVWRPVAALVALLLDVAKFLFIHPARGPFTLTTVAALILFATH